MKVTLNKANKLRNALEKHSCILPLTFQMVSTVDDYENRLDDILKSFALEEIKFVHLNTLRQIIAEINRAVGIDFLMGQIASAEKFLACFPGQTRDRYGTVVLGGRNVSTVGDFRIEIENNKLKAAKDQQFVSPILKATVSVEKDEEFVAYCDLTVSFLKKKIEKLKEERNFLNYKTEIDLPDGLVTFLTELGLL